MLSSHDPQEFWKAVGRITGWRLLSFDGFNEGMFTNASMDTVLVSHEIASVIDSLVSAIGDLSYSSLGLIEAVELMLNGSASEKRRARATLSSNVLNHKNDLRNLQSELPHLFAHYRETEQEDPSFVVGSA